MGLIIKSDTESHTYTRSEELTRRCIHRGIWTSRLFYPHLMAGYKKITWEASKAQVGRALHASTLRRACRRTNLQLTRCIVLHVLSFHQPTRHLNLHYIFKGMWAENKIIVSSLSVLLEHCTYTLLHSRESSLLIWFYQAVIASRLLAVFLLILIEHRGLLNQDICVFIYIWLWFPINVFTTLRSNRTLRIYLIVNLQ